MVKIYSKDEYSKAYTELLQILKHISQADFNKIPRDLIEFFEKNKDVEYHYNYNEKIPFREQSILRLTKILIANIYIDYWMTDKEKQIIKKEENEYFIALEKEKREKYNANNLFTQKEEYVKENNSETSLVVVKNKNIITRIIEKIREKLQKLKK